MSYKQNVPLTQKWGRAGEVAAITNDNQVKITYLTYTCTCCITSLGIRPPTNFYYNLDPRALTSLLCMTEGEKSSKEPRNKVSSHWFL